MAYLKEKFRKIKKKRFKVLQKRRRQRLPIIGSLTNRNTEQQMNKIDAILNSFRNEGH